MALKWRVVALFALFTALSMATGAAVLVVNARAAVRAEMDSALTLARAVAGAGVPAGSLAGLGQRHIRVTTPDGPPAALIPPSVGEEPAPAWFAALIGVTPQEHRLPTMTLTAEPWDEIAEVWEDLTSLGLAAAGLSAVLLALAAWAAGRALRPLTLFERGLDRLRAGDFTTPPDDTFLSGGGAPELARIGGRIAALADSLRRADGENRRLSLQLVQVQDRERRDLAREIHDELGAALFSLKIDITALRTAASTPAAAERAQSALTAVEGLHRLSRRVLTRLRPEVLDHLPLSEVLREMVAAEQRRQPGVAWDFTAEGDIDGLEEPARLTVYRLIQEGITNALRHAAPSRIAVGIRRPESERVEVTVRDDGAGVDTDGGKGPGFGLSGMAERVHALGGRLVVAPEPGGGTGLRAIIPVSPAAAEPLSCAP